MTSDTITSLSLVSALTAVIPGHAAAQTHDIDRAAAYYLASEVGLSVRPVFVGGTLRTDLTKGVYGQNFTLDGSPTNTIDQFGKDSTFTGVFSDGTAGIAGNLVFTNSGSDGSIPNSNIIGLLEEVGQNYALNGSPTNAIDQLIRVAAFTNLSGGTAGITGNLTPSNSSNSGSVTLTGTNIYTGMTTIMPGAHLIIGSGGSITHSNIIANSGFLEVAPQGAVAVSGISSNRFGLILNEGSWTGNVANSIALAINTGTWNGNVANYIGVAGNAGTWNGNVTNYTGLAINAGAWNGNVANYTGLAINVRTWNGNVANYAGQVTNLGTWNGTATNYAGQVINSGNWNGTAANYTGQTTNLGTWNGNVSNYAGQTTNLGTWNGNISNYAGETINVRNWNGSLLSNTGGILNNGTWNSPFLTNDRGSVTTTGTVNVASTLTNGGTFYAKGTVNASLIENTGSFNVIGPLTGTIGTFNNAGTLNLANGNVTDVFRVGAYQGQGGRLIVDVNLLNNTNAVRGDVLQADTTSGTTYVSIDNVAHGRSYFATPIPIIQSSGGGTTFDLVDTPSAGLVDYNLAEVSRHNWSLVSSINPRSSSFSASTVASALALNTGFFQNASSFVSLPESPEPNKWAGGPWIRIADGRNDVNAIGTTPNGNGGARSAPSLVRTRFNGFQTGVDLGYYNIENSGFSAVLGMTAGRATLNSSELSGYNSTNAIQVPFIGIYGLFAGHGFFADFQVREDFYQMNLSYPEAYVHGNSLTGTSLGANGSIGYHWNITKDFFVEPTAALIYSDLHVNGLQVGIDPANDVYGTVTFQPIESLLGRFGGRIGANYVLEDIDLVMQPFLIANVWREFAGDAKSTFNANGSAVPISLTRVGTFGQVGLGFSSSVLNTGLVGFFHGDYRLGDQFRGYALNAGLRYQF
ncbi:autotransporter domain-containing protein [Beijerinckia indica]|uniref:autotransporter domain-containing protein n=1 Tax=Beijerinckia indica TaxID=533 RepID=UPI0003152928|nr:autotransporter domain-containing protein [Beijerinckia indica]